MQRPYAPEIINSSCLTIHPTTGNLTCINNMESQLDTSRPDVLAGITENERLELDVRDVLRSGGEPFGQIMEAIGKVPRGHVFCLRATFKPVPLFGVLRVQGWKHWIEYGQGDDWMIWFYREKDFT